MTTRKDLSGGRWSWSSTQTIWTGRMAWLWMGHGNLSFTSLDRVGSDLSGSGAPTSTPFPHGVTAVPIPQLCSTEGPLPNILPSWARTAFLTLLPCICFASHKSKPSSLPQGTVDSYSTPPWVTWEAVTVVEGIPWWGLLRYRLANGAMVYPS